MINLKAGDRIRITYKIKREVYTSVLDVVEAPAGKNFIVVTNGRYKETLDRFEFEKGKMKLEVLKKEDLYGVKL